MIDHRIHGMVKWEVQEWIDWDSESIAGAAGDRSSALSGVYIFKALSLLDLDERVWFQLPC